MKRPTWSSAAEGLCRCYISGSVTVIVCTFVISLDRYGRVGVEALWPWTVGWSIAGVPVCMLAKSWWVQLGVLAGALACLFVGLIGSLPVLA